MQAASLVRDPEEGRTRVVDDNHNQIRTPATQDGDHFRRRRRGRRCGGHGAGGTRRTPVPLRPHQDPVQELAQAISSRGQTAAAAHVDALDEDAVNSYLDDVVATTGRIDIVFNAMGPQAVEYRNATSTLELPAEAFMLPMTTILRSQFITARAPRSTSSKRGLASSSSSPQRLPRGFQHGGDRRGLRRHRIPDEVPGR